MAVRELPQPRADLADCTFIPGWGVLIRQPGKRRSTVIRPHRAAGLGAFWQMITDIGDVGLARAILKNVRNELLIAAALEYLRRSH